jgi:hypothetical protein
LGLLGGGHGELTRCWRSSLNPRSRRGKGTPFASVFGPLLGPHALPHTLQTVGDDGLPGAAEGLAEDNVVLGFLARVISVGVSPWWAGICGASGASCNM